MKIAFSLTTASAVVAALQAALQGRKLAEMVAISAAGEDVVVTISKFGTSTLTFTQTAATSGLEFELTGEKVAFTHKAFRNEVKEKLVQVIEKAGGRVMQA